MNSHGFPTVRSQRVDERLKAICNQHQPKRLEALAPGFKKAASSLRSCRF